MEFDKDEVVAIRDHTVEGFGVVWGSEHVGEGLGDAGVDRDAGLFGFNHKNPELILSNENVDFAANGEVMVLCEDIDRFLARCIEGWVVETCEFEQR